MENLPAAVPIGLLGLLLLFQVHLFLFPFLTFLTNEMESETVIVLFKTRLYVTSILSGFIMDSNVKRMLLGLFRNVVRFSKSNTFLENRYGWANSFGESKHIVYKAPALCGS